MGTPHRPAVEGIAWGCAIFVLWLWAGFTPANPAVSFAASGLATVYGVRVFIGHGGARVTVLGLFNLASVMFVGVSGFYAALDPASRASDEYLVLAVLAATTLMILVSTLAWGAPRTVTYQPAPAPVCRWLTHWGLATLLALTALHFLGPDALAAWLEAGAYAATTVLAVGVLWNSRARLISPGMILIAAAFVSYTMVFHTGGGRLRIVALACTLAILITFRFPHRAIKPLIIAAIPLALMLLAQQRLTLQEQISGGVSGNTGLESMLVPIVVLALLIQAQASGMPLDFGENLLSIPAAFLPESWLPGAPEAIGYQLVQVHHPSRVGTGFSTAGTLAGEHVFSFGLLGVVIAAPLVAVLFRVLDNRVVDVASRAHTTRLSALLLVLWAMVGGAVADMAWAGTHIFVMRTVQRLPVWLGLIVLAYLVDGLSQRTNTRSLPARKSVGA